MSPLQLREIALSQQSVSVINLLAGQQLVGGQRDLPLINLLQLLHLLQRFLLVDGYVLFHDSLDLVLLTPDQPIPLLPVQQLLLKLSLEQPLFLDEIFLQALDSVAHLLLDITYDCLVLSVLLLVLHQSLPFNADHLTA